MLEMEDDKEVFHRLYEENRHVLFLIARKIVRSDAEAEDAVHTGFLRLAENYERYRELSYKELRKVCCGITRFVAIDMAREYQKEGDYLQRIDNWEACVRDTQPDVLEQLIREYDAKIIKSALRKLTASERELIGLIYSLELTSQEIGELMGISAAAVRKRLMKCRQKLEGLLKRDDYGSV